MRRFSWPANRPPASRLHFQNAFLPAHGFLFLANSSPCRSAGCGEELLAHVEQQRISVLSTHFQECAAPRLMPAKLPGVSLFLA
jgi:hypothetical protein